MFARLFLPAVTIFSLLFQSRVAAQQLQQRWQDRNGYTYEVYEVYPQGHYPQQQQQHVPQNSQNYYPQQQKPTVSATEAEWVCTNSRTKDMMIIASKDIPGIFKGQAQQPNYPQHQQPNYPQQPNHSQQPNYPQQQPNYPQRQPNYPQHPNYLQQPNYPNQQPVTPTTTTTNEEPRPVWPAGDNGYKPGFTVVEGTPKPQQSTHSGTSLAPVRPQLQPVKPSQNKNDPNEYGDIEIVMG